MNKVRVLSASMDRSVKLWDMQSLQAIQSFPAAPHVLNPLGSFMHDGTSYQAIWHPTHESIFASSSADQMCRVWDLRSGKDIKKIWAGAG